MSIAQPYHCDRHGSHSRRTRVCGACYQELQHERDGLRQERGQLAARVSEDIAKRRGLETDYEAMKGQRNDLRQQRNELAAALDYHFSRCLFGPETEPWPHAKAILAEHDAAKDAEIAKVNARTASITSWLREWIRYVNSSQGAKDPSIRERLIADLEMRVCAGEKDVIGASISWLREHDAALVKPLLTALDRIRKLLNQTAVADASDCANWAVEIATRAINTYNAALAPYKPIGVGVGGGPQEGEGMSVREPQTSHSSTEIGD